MSTQRTILTRLAGLGLELPEPPRPAGRYKPVMQAGAMLYVSAQLPFIDGALKYRGQVGAELTLEQGRDAAAIAALNVLSQLCAALGDLDRLESLVFVEGHVASAPDFNRQPQVLDGASELFHAALAERAGHARSAFAPSRLPLNAPAILVVTAMMRSGE